MRWALVQSGVVENIIIAESDFITAIEGDWEYCVDLTGADPHPQIGWTYDGETFSPPA
jgi:hypothetical protein